MDKLQVGDLVRVENYRPKYLTVFGLVVDTNTREWSSACVLIDEQKWWIPFEKLEKVNG